MLDLVFVDYFAPVFILKIFGLFTYHFISTSESFMQSYSLSNFYVLFYVYFLFVYVFGLLGVLFNIKNMLISLLFIEITYFGIVCLFLFFAVFLKLEISFLYALLILLVAAAESVVGLGFVVVIFQFQRIVMFSSFSTLAV